MILAQITTRVTVVLSVSRPLARRITRAAEVTEHAAGTCVGIEFILRGMQMHLAPVLWPVLLLTFAALLTFFTSAEDRHDA